MITRLIFLLGIVFGASESGPGLYAQALAADSDIYRPMFAIKFVPFALLDRTPTLQFAAEIRTFPHQSFQLEGGYIWDLYNSSPTSDFNGYKLRAEYRFYRHKSHNISTNSFWGIHYMHKLVEVFGTAAVWRQNRSYQEILPFRLSNRTNAYYLVIGRVFPNAIGRIALELVVGGGLRQLNITLIDTPEDVSIDTIIPDRIFNPVNGVGIYTYLDMLLSFKIIYPFN